MQQDMLIVGSNFVNQYSQYSVNSGPNLRKKQDREMSEGASAGNKAGQADHRADFSKVRSGNKADVSQNGIRFES